MDGWPKRRREKPGGWMVGSLDLEFAVPAATIAPTIVCTTVGGLKSQKKCFLDFRLLSRWRQCKAWWMPRTFLLWPWGRVAFLGETWSTNPEVVICWCPYIIYICCLVVDPRNDRSKDHEIHDLWSHFRIYDIMLPLWCWVYIVLYSDLVIGYFPRLLGQISSLVWHTYVFEMVLKQVPNSPWERLGFFWPGEVFFAVGPLPIPGELGFDCFEAWIFAFFFGFRSWMLNIRSQ